MFDVGEIIDNKYLVDGVCSDAGGMGTILFVTPSDNLPFPVVLKFCKSVDPEQLTRFRREVRLLGTFKGNKKVAQLAGKNLTHDPPYFVMKYYPDGDLERNRAAQMGSYEAQERCFLSMIDCIHELHTRNEFHRDIKPQNFLLDGEHIVVSDLGLATETGSGTAFTRSSVWWGTHGYIPPEFLAGGFKTPDAPGDIFMLGKTIYVLLTGRDPMYIVEDDVPPPLVHIIQRCCSIPKHARYQTLAELKQSLVAAYDVLLGRGGGVAVIKQLLQSISDNLGQGATYDPDEVGRFVEHLAIADEADQINICREIPAEFFSMIGETPVVAHLERFLNVYQKLVDGQDYGFSFAETIASNMRWVFVTREVPYALKATALDHAIRAAYYMNRFAAMDTCISMITSINDEVLGLQVAPVLVRHGDTFVARIELGDCHSEAVRAALRQIQDTPA